MVLPIKGLRRPSGRCYLSAASQGQVDGVTHQQPLLSGTWGGYLSAASESRLDGATSQLPQETRLKI
jgi:hypothetical protein